MTGYTPLTFDALAAEPPRAGSVDPGAGGSLDQPSVRMIRWAAGSPDGAAGPPVNEHTAFGYLAFYK